MMSLGNGSELIINDQTQQALIIFSVVKHSIAKVSAA
jgi:hypothetical protein